MRAERVKGLEDLRSDLARMVNAKQPIVEERTCKALITSPTEESTKDKKERSTSSKAGMTSGLWQILKKVTGGSVADALGAKKQKRATTSSSSRSSSSSAEKVRKKKQNIKEARRESKAKNVKDKHRQDKGAKRSGLPTKESTTRVAYRAGERFEALQGRDK